MRIGIDASRAASKQKTGTEYYSFEIIRNMIKIDDKNEYILYAKSPLGNIFPDLPKNVSVKVMKFPKLWSQIRLSFEMFRDPPDVLFVPAHTIPFYHPKNTVVTLHDVGFKYYPDLYTPLERYYHDFCMKFSVRHAKKIISISLATEKDIIKLYDADPKKISVIYHGFDYDKYFIERTFDQTEYSEQLKKAPYLFFIGRLEAKKNVVNLIRSFALLRKESRVKHKLVLAGRPGYQYELMKDEIEKLPEEIKGDIIELGYVSDMDAGKYLRCADILIFPSRFEGFGMPLLEAMASGIPVVASDTTSIPEIVSDAGILCNPDKPFGFAAACSKIINSTSLREDLIRKGLKRSKEFSWESSARKTLSIIEECNKD